MTRSDYQELVGFLGPKFDAIDGRFEAIDRRFEAIDRRFDAIDTRLDGVEDRLTRVEVGAEKNRHHIQIVAEGVTAVREDMARDFTAVRKEMADGFEGHGKLILGLSARMDRWEGRSA